MMPDMLKIREFKSSDTPFLIEVLRLNIPQYFAESEVDDLQEYLEYKTEMYFVAEIEGNIIGGGGINYADDYRTGKLSWDFVDPKFQGEGVGTKLLNHRINLLKSMQSMRTIVVRTSQFAYKFYEKNNFVLDSIVRDYWSEGIDLYNMKYKY